MRAVVDKGNLQMKARKSLGLTCGDTEYGPNEISLSFYNLPWHSDSTTRHRRICWDREYSRLRRKDKTSQVTPSMGLRPGL